MPQKRRIDELVHAVEEILTLSNGQCCICQEDIDDSTSAYNMLTCHKICISCLATSLATQVTNHVGPMSDYAIACPGIMPTNVSHKSSITTKCTTKFTIGSVFAFLNGIHSDRGMVVVGNAISRLSESMVLEMLNKESQGNKICPKCNVLNEMSCISDNSSKGITCMNSKCAFVFCMCCYGDWSRHNGKDCATFRKDDLLESTKGLDDKIKQCPKCQMNIEISGGCDHMTCKLCNYEFCFLCGAKYEVGHFMKHVTPDKVVINIPGESRPMAIALTPHVIYTKNGSQQQQQKQHEEQTQTSTLYPTVVNGSDIRKLFQEHDVVKILKFESVHPVTGEKITKEGILLKRRKLVL